MLTGGRVAAVIVLGLLAISTVAIAAVTESAIPLFAAWAAQFAMIMVVSRADRQRDAAAAAASGPEETPASETSSGA